MLHEFERLISHDPKFLFTSVSYLLIFLIYINLTEIHLLLIGVLAFILFFLIDGVFLANAFFPKESMFFRLTFGLLLLVMLLGFVGWLIMLAYNLDTPLFLLSLMVATTVSSMLNWERKKKNAAK